MLKKAIKGKEQDVMNEMNVLKGLEHENIVRPPPPGFPALPYDSIDPN